MAKLLELKGKVNYRWGQIKIILKSTDKVPTSDSGTPLEEEAASTQPSTGNVSECKDLNQPTSASCASGPSSSGGGKTTAVSVPVDRTHSASIGSNNAVGHATAGGSGSGTKATATASSVRPKLQKKGTQTRTTGNVAGNPHNTAEVRHRTTGRPGQAACRSKKGPKKAQLLRQAKANQP